MKPYADYRFLTHNKLVAKTHGHRLYRNNNDRLATINEEIMLFLIIHDELNKKKGL
jgi:hypothetical protein